MNVEDFEFRTGYITKDNGEAFYPLMLPESVERIKDGAPTVAIGLTCGDTAIGAICGDGTGENVLSIASFFVAPEYRNQGGGTMLLDDLISLLPEEITTVSFAYTDLERDQRTLGRFLGRYGFYEDDSPRGIYYISVWDLMHSAFFEKAYKSKAVVTMSGLSEQDIMELEKFAKTHVLPRTEGGFRGEAVDKDHSVIMREHGEIQGYLAVDDSLQGEITVSAVYYEDEEVLEELLAGLIGTLGDVRGKMVRVFFPAPDAGYAAMIRSLFPEATNIEHHMDYFML